MFQSSRLEDHMKTIGIDQSSFTRSSSEHRCMDNIKNIYQHAGKFDDQQNLKDTLEAALLSTPEGFIDKSPNLHLSIFLFFLSFYLSIPHSKKKSFFFSFYSFSSFIFFLLFICLFLSLFLSFPDLWTRLVCRND